MPQFSPEYLRRFKLPSWKKLCRLLKIGRCAWCKKRGRTELHHKHYDNLGNESAYDFVELCHYCHETVTAVRRIKNISTAEATEIVRQWRERR
jgi:hypothetical protein